MKISQKDINRIELIAGINKDPGFSFASFDKAGILIPDRFKGSCHGRSDGDNTPALTSGEVNCRGGFRRNLESLFMHLVLKNVFNPNRQKSPKPDMQGDKPDLDTGINELLQQLAGKVKPGSRGR